MPTTDKLAEKLGWDKELLALELQHLVDIGFDIDRSALELAETDLVIIEGMGEESEQPENLVRGRFKLPVISQPGDVWLLGKHILVCGDFDRTWRPIRLPTRDERADFVFTDPPYNVRIDGHVSGLGRIKHREFAMASGEMKRDPVYRILFPTCTDCCASTLNDGSIHQICMDWRHMREMLAAGDAHYTELKNVCIWKKSNAGMGSFYRSSNDTGVFVWKNGTVLHINTFELGQHGR